MNFGYIKHPNLVLEFTTFIKSEHKKFFSNLKNIHSQGTKLIEFRVEK